MRNKGFTLIELLAVIVILAVIAVITVPMIMNVIDKSKLGALEDSAYGLVETANLYYSSNLASGIDTIEFTCDINGCINGDKKLNYKGSIDSGKVKLYSDGKVSICIENGTNVALKKAIDTKVTTAAKGSCNTTNDEYSIDEVVSLNKYNEMKKEYEKKLQEAIAGQLDTSNATATELDILIDKTAYVNKKKITGTMKNNGELDWNPVSSTSYVLPAGYYSGGTISTTNAYSLGYNAGLKEADSRVNTESASYQSGYNVGKSQPKTVTVNMATADANRGGGATLYLNGFGGTVIGTQAKRTNVTYTITAN